MKRILFLVLLLPFSVLAQQKCDVGYIHVNQVLDSLPMPPEVQKSVDSAQHVAEYMVTKAADSMKSLKKAGTSHLDNKTIKKKLAHYRAKEEAGVLKLKHTLLQKHYATKIRDATLVVYNKGKNYGSVINADSPVFAKGLPEHACNATAECLKAVRDLMK